MKSLFVTIFLSSGLLCLAQFMPTNTRIQTPYGPTTVKTYQYVPNMYGMAYNMSYIKTKFQFEVILQNNDTLNIKSRIEQDSIQYLSYKKDGKKIEIKPEETKQITSSSFSEFMHGIPSDSCWLFLTKEGKVDIYSDRPVSGTACAVAFQIGHDEIKSLTKYNLSHALPPETDQKVIKHIDRNKLIKAIYRYNQ